MFGALCSNEFHDSIYNCPSSAAGEECSLYNGNFILESLGLSANWVTEPTIISIRFAVFCYLGSWIGLAFGGTEPVVSSGHARAPNNGHNHEHSVGKAIMAGLSIASLRSLDVGLHEFALDMDQRSSWGTKQLRRSIFAPITANFEAGQLNVVMGPSGCGITSLLNAVAHRLNSNFRVPYRLSGRLLLNGTEPSNTVIQSVASYVSQNDDGLPPSLTVRETLHFAAALRLPSHLSEAANRSQAEQILRKLGLKDCADIMVGNELLKGISGGEKRRVTIAVQVLMNPRILLLDEPTSGLDAFRAGSIIEVLHGLANEGQTIILSLHQSRSDIFGQFGNLLLLAKAGQPVYSGPAEDVLDYFDKCLGCRCPKNMNPADFIIDNISADTKQSKELSGTRKTHLSAEKWAAHMRETRVAVPRIADLETLKTIPEGNSNTTTPHVSVPNQRSLFKRQISKPAEIGALLRQRTGLTTSLPVLLNRGLINFRRQPPVLLGRTMQVVGLAVVITCFFAPLKSDYASIQTRVGFIQ